MYCIYSLIWSLLSIIWDHLQESCFPLWSIFVNLYFSTSTHIGSYSGDTMIDTNILIKWIGALVSMNSIRHFFTKEWSSLNKKIALVQGIRWMSLKMLSLLNFCTTQMNWWGHALSFNVYCIFSFNLIIGDTTVYIKRMYKNRASLALVVAKNKIYKQNQVHTYIHIQST